MQALSPPASPKRDGSPNSSSSSNNDEDQTRYIFFNTLKVYKNNLINILIYI